MSEDAAVIICATKENLPVPPVPSQVCWCTLCATELWLSNTMVRQLAGKLADAKPMCIDCAQGVMATAKETEVTLLPEQEQELADHGILDEMRTFVKRLNGR